MNIQEYISSGLLELHAAGALSENEIIEVESNIRKYPELRAEYENIIQALYLSTLTNLKTPSKDVKSKILNRIKLSERTSDLVSRREPIEYKNNTKTYSYLMAASVAFLLISLAANFFLWNKLNDAKTEILVLADQRKIMVQEFEAVSHKLSVASTDMQIMKDRNYKMVDLKGLENSPSSDAVAFWNPETKKLYVSVMNLPVPPPNKQYQLWALDDGKPINAGTMDVDPNDKSLHEMKSMDDAQAFAITLEPKGGSVNPTMDQMYVMGKL